MNAHQRRKTFQGVPEPKPFEDLPSVLDAEQALLGALLVNNDAIPAVPDTFLPEHFYEPIHRAIYEAILKCRETKKNANPLTVRLFMSPDTASVKIGEMTVSQYLANLASNATSIVNVPWFADGISEYYDRRQVISVSEDAVIAARKAEDEGSLLRDIMDCRGRLDAIITEIQARNSPEPGFDQSLDQALDQTSAANRGGEIGMDPKIPEIKSLIGNLQAGKLVIIGGDVKTGKSALGWQLFFSIAENHAVAGFTGEMPTSQVIMRELARRTGIAAKRQRLGQISQHEMDALVRARADMKRLKFIDITDKQMTIEDIDRKIERLQGEKGIEFFLVDHILKLLWNGKMEDADDFKKGNKATSMLKNIAMKRNICIGALTHINKSANYDGGKGSFDERLNAAIRKRPTYKSMLGNCDKDADDMIIVHQAYPAVTNLEPEKDTPDYEKWERAMNFVKGRAEFILALSRENEFPSWQEVRWNGATTSFGAPFNDAVNRRGMF